MKLFDRVIELWVGDTFINGLDIAFEIEKDLSPEPNPCHIEIYNLSQANRTTLSKYEKVPVLLKAGYKDNVGVTFQGDMVSCIHEKEGPTWKTTLASGDGALKQLEVINQKLDRGFSISGCAMDELNRVLKQHGFGTSVQNNSLQLLKQGESLAGKAINLSATSGLKGSPQMGSG